MSPKSVAEAWYSRVVSVAYSHYRAALHFSRLNFWFGIPSVILATIVGTSIFVTLQAQPDFWWQVIVGVMSIAAAVLTALQSFLGYNDKSERHRTAGAKYNAIGRELELWLSLPEENLENLESIRQQIDSLAQDSPHIPEAVHRELTKQDRVQRNKANA